MLPCSFRPPLETRNTEAGGVTASRVYFRWKKCWRFESLFVVGRPVSNPKPPQIRYCFCTRKDCQWVTESHWPLLGKCAGLCWSRRMHGVSKCAREAEEAAKIGPAKGILCFGIRV
ncbi:hypothetical protein NDU88_003038 [Pleurodeles waltl]|uniref:Uncharacterized protein n=1 Tax=Pleurodeles waltl TaxID=8319 RepID=A0AAV7SEG5_PLEWA|nr:hypothetical protein NDU88_003038 [Pleurodeles waltl]